MVLSVVLLVSGLPIGAVLLAEVVAVGGILAIDRFATPVIERWSRGATGEEHVGRLLADLEVEGWHAIHDIDTGRGNIDSLVIGPGGVFTIEVKSHGGKTSADRVDPRMLRQAYAQKKWVEEQLGHSVTPLLVFSRAYLLGRAISRRKGVVVLPARMLCDHLRRRAATLSEENVAALHARLATAAYGSSR